MFLALLIVDENFTVLAVAARFVLGGPDNGEDILCLLEDVVHLLERAVSRLRVKEVDDWEDEGIAVGEISTWYQYVSMLGLHDGEDDVGLVADGRERHRRDHDDHEVECPVRTSRQCIGWRPDS